MSITLEEALEKRKEKLKEYDDDEGFDHPLETVYKDDVEPVEAAVWEISRLQEMIEQDRLDR